MESEDRVFAIAEKISSKAPSLLSPGQQTFKIVWELEAEVYGGGFQQYFLNSSGRYAPRVESALRTIGASKIADLAAKAIGVVDAADLDWSDDEYRHSHMAKLGPNVGPTLYALDAKFFDYPDPLTQLLANYIDAHPEDFGD